MSVRKKTGNRLTLYRTCHTCGKNIVTTADTPWIRQVPNVDGKKQKTCYFCCEKCFAASYKHIGFFDGKTQQRREEREASRDKTEKNRRYYEAHAEEIRKRRREYYWNNLEEERKNNKFQKEKRKLLESGA